MRRHVQKVLGGEYEMPHRATRPVILDIGANVGSFAARALKRWPGAHVHCYEPLPDNMLVLANFYYKGDYGVGYNPGEAKLLTQAADRGDPSAKEALANLERNLADDAAKE